MNLQLEIGDGVRANLSFLGTPVYVKLDASILEEIRNLDQLLPSGWDFAATDPHRFKGLDDPLTVRVDVGFGNQNASLEASIGFLKDIFCSP